MSLFLNLLVFLPCNYPSLPFCPTFNTRGKSLFLSVITNISSQMFPSLLVCQDVRSFFLVSRITWLHSSLPSFVVLRLSISFDHSYVLFILTFSVFRFCVVSWNNNYLCYFIIVNTVQTRKKGIFIQFNNLEIPCIYYERGSLLTETKKKCNRKFYVINSVRFLKHTDVYV